MLSLCRGEELGNHLSGINGPWLPSCQGNGASGPPDPEPSFYIPGKYKFSIFASGITGPSRSLSSKNTPSIRK